MTPTQIADLRARAEATRQYRNHLRDQVALQERYGDTAALARFERDLRDAETDLLRLERILLNG